MELFRLGTVGWEDSYLLYHLLPRLGREGVLLLRPDRPYLSMGYHGDRDQEVNSDVLRRSRLPLRRREVGGGLVLLDAHQIFFQVILSPTRPGLPRRREELYRLLLQPAMAALQALGLEAEYYPPCDLRVGGRKISGNGAGEIAGMMVFVGNLLLDFDYSRMAAAFRAPSALFTFWAERALRENLTTLRRELGRVPDYGMLEGLLAQGFADVLGPLEPGAVEGEEAQRLRSILSHRFHSTVWNRGVHRPPADRRLKIQEDLYLVEALRGPLQVIFLERQGRLETVQVEGLDGIMLPDLTGLPRTRAALETRLAPLGEEGRWVLAALLGERGTGTRSAGMPVIAERALP